VESISFNHLAKSFDPPGENMPKTISAENDIVIHNIDLGAFMA